MPGLPPPARTARLLRLQAVAVFLLALLVRLAYFGEQSAAPWFGAPLLDARHVAGQAALLLDTGSFAPGPFFRPPLYTLFVAPMVAALPGAPVAAVAFVQHLLGAAWALLMLWTGRRAGGSAAGLAAGILAALYAPAVFHEGEMLSDSLTLFLSSAMLLAWLRARPRGGALPHAMAGTLAGLAAITRPTALLPAAALAAGAAWCAVRGAGRGARRRAVVAVAAFLLPLAVLVALPSLRNAAQGDYNLVASQGGINFWLGNNPEANGVSVIVPPVRQSGDAAYRDSVQVFGTGAYLAATGAPATPPPPDSAVSRYWYGRAFAWMRSHPADAASLAARKVVAALNNHEVRNNRGFHFAREHTSLVLRLLPVTFGLVAALAVAGVAAVGRLRPRRRAACRWLILSAVAALAGVVAFFVAGRLRLPLAGHLIPLAGVGTAALWRAAARRDARAAAAPALAACLAAAFSFWSWPVLDYRLSPDQPPGLGLRATRHAGMDFALLAQGALDNGRASDAMVLAVRAAREAPALPYAHSLVGEAALAAGEPLTAARAFHTAATLRPDDPAAFANLGVAMEALGHPDAAARLYRAALDTDPANASANANLALLLHRAGRTDDARRLALAAVAGGATPPAAMALLGRGDIPEQLRRELTSPLPPDTDLDTPATTETALAHARSLLQTGTE